MSLSFPNLSRNFDSRNQCVRFVGYDGMSETKFFVAADALSSAKSQRNTSEDDYLASFDDLRSAILKAADAAYTKKRGNMIGLDVQDLR
ncbi:DUF1488 domain-containing protein [Rhizobium sp. NFR03]|uniref:DUF1488 domain-containing protein n=1 Tax=Rhizobium sp. NFR03 TaxID=1566263 RepID=UPI000B87B19E|nr:DUF1488 domain-containing protein [Rhizobium sp. NFR03]